MADANGQLPGETNKVLVDSSSENGSNDLITKQKPMANDKEFESIIEGLEATSKAFRALKREHDATRTEVEDLRKQNQALVELNQSLTRRISDLDAEKVKDREEIEHLSKELSECKSIRDKYEDLRKEYESLKEKLNKIPKISY